MELVYLWVEDYKNIHKQGFNFSPRFECTFHDEYDENGKLKENCKLEIIEKKEDEYIKDFFGENINVTAIVGKNGSGKSSVLELLNEYCHENHVVSKYPISHMELKLLNVYYDNQSNEILLYTQQLNPIKSITCNHAIKYLKIQQILEENIFKKSFLSPSLSRTQEDYLDILHFIKSNNLKFPFFIPNIINIGIHDDYGDLLDLIHCDDNDTIYDKFMVFDENTKSRFKTFHILLLLAYLHNNQIKFNIELLGCYDEMISILEGFVEDKKIIDKINKFIKIMDKYVLDGYIPSDNYIEIDNLSNNFFDSYREIINYSNNKSKKVFFFSFHPILSGGEYQFIYLLSQIYSHIYQEETLLLIDEGETFLHPNWQKKYLSYIVQFIKDNFPNRKIHIILTSHSPFLLSDIPKQNIIFLDKEENGNCKVLTHDEVLNKKQTFGANIHTLLSDSFFMEDGLMGEFAKSKINEIIDFHKLVKKNRHTDCLTKIYLNSKQKKFWQTQKIIGEEYLKQVIKNHLVEIEKKLLGKDRAKQEEIKRVEAYLESLKK